MGSDAVRGPLHAGGIFVVLAGIQVLRISLPAELCWTVLPPQEKGITPLRTPLLAGIASSATATRRTNHVPEQP